MQTKLLLTGLLAAALLSACGAPAATTPTAPTAPAAAVVSSQPTTAPTAAPTAPPAPSRVSGTGEVRAARTANLAFPIGGRVAEVRITEGDRVNEGDVLVVLDPRPLDAAVQQAEAGVALAQAQAAALNDPPSAAEVQAARAEVQRAEAEVQRAQVAQAQATSLQAQDMRAADATLASAAATLQQTRDQLSAAKTNAQLQMEQSANQLRNTQDEYSRIYWENRRLEQALSQPVPVAVNEETGDVTEYKPGQELPQDAKDREAAALRAVKSAETALEQARLAYEQAQKNEVTGVQTAEQQLAQAQVGRDRAAIGQTQEQVISAAQAQLAAAQAGVNRLQPAPRPGQRAQAAASIAQAEATLAAAKLNREQAELRAPFSGVVASLGVQVGETAGAEAVLTLLDISVLRFEVAVADVDIGRVQLNQRADMQFDALPDVIFAGTVSYIAPAAVTQGNLRTYLVRVDMKDIQRVRVGMNGRLVLR
ncbi:MAG: HlyD family efflux transporter periplasmic adaptor subunit [Chloroflexaceae bacterium]|jgi:HlyD family secretion protein|nr:HlyD family efflux transporter periplasmic adaptor subunit [Chloroflexaceae bacterium]